METSRILEIILTGIMTGFGTALGSYLAVNHALKQLGKVKKIIKLPLKLVRR
ncbi:MAG: hypothetical protein AABY15_04800 [Nanoarchaeota archaeon]